MRLGLLHIDIAKHNMRYLQGYELVHYELFWVVGRSSGTSALDWNGVAFGKTIIDRRKTSHKLLYTLINS
jgi:hypothetical protein